MELKSCLSELLALAHRSLYFEHRFFVLSSYFGGSGYMALPNQVGMLHKPPKEIVRLSRPISTSIRIPTFSDCNHYIALHLNLWGIDLLLGRFFSVFSKLPAVLKEPGFTIRAVPVRAFPENPYWKLASNVDNHTASPHAIILFPDSLAGSQSIAIDQYILGPTTMLSKSCSTCRGASGSWQAFRCRILSMLGSL